MRKSLLTAMLAASALIPAAAMAQDNADHPNRPAGRGEGRPAGQAQRAARPAQGAAPQAAAPQARPVAPAAAQGPQGRGGRPDAAGGNFQGRPGFQGRGGQGDRPQGQPGQPSQAQQQARPFDGGSRGGRPDVAGGQQRGGDARVNGGYRPDGRGNDGRGYNRPGNDGRGNDGRGYQGRGNDGRGYAGGGYGINVGRGWSRDWRQDNRYNYNNYRNQNRSLYHLPRYYAPSGWGYGYRRFSVGYELNSILFGQNYWIGDPGYYRLPPAYGPYRWVRYYNDALLVDLETGEVVDTVYDIFW